MKLIPTLMSPTDMMLFNQLWELIKYTYNINDYLQ